MEQEKNIGTGKEYYFNGEIKFEGEYKNGKRWNGKGYNKKGELEFELKNGNGIIKEYRDIMGNALEYEVEYKNGLKDGKGREYYYYTNKLIFEGEYKNDLRNGKGKNMGRKIYKI